MHIFLQIDFLTVERQIIRDPRSSLNSDRVATDKLGLANQQKRERLPSSHGEHLLVLVGRKQWTRLFDKLMRNRKMPSSSEGMVYRKGAARTFIP